MTVSPDWHQRLQNNNLLILIQRQSCWLLWSVRTGCRRPHSGRDGEQQGAWPQSDPKLYVYTRLTQMSLWTPWKSGVLFTRYLVRPEQRHGNKVNQQAHWQTTGFYLALSEHVTCPATLRENGVNVVSSVLSFPYSTQLRVIWDRKSSWTEEQNQSVVMWFSCGVQSQVIWVISGVFLTSFPPQWERSNDLSV